MPCLPSELEEMKLKGLEIHYGWGPKEVVQGSRMQLVACTRVFDDQGRFAPSCDESKTMELDFDQVILAVGQAVEPGLATYLKEEFQTDGLLEVEEETLQVKGRVGLYAGGDIIRGAGTIVEAVADGRRAAGAIDHATRGSK
jgi:NADPH-dependent glutamate synthase beta subunit-like oxidoreductase